MDWDDLRLVLAVARDGSLRGAASALRTSHATLSRHITELQERLGVRLFERHGRTLRPTEAGADLVGTAEQIEREVDGLTRRIAGRDFSLRGTVRVAMAPSLLQVLAPRLAELSAVHPDIRLELVTGLQLSNLGRREADVVVRVTDEPPPTLVGRRVARFMAAAYGRPDLLDALEPCAVGAMPWVTWDERHAFKPAIWVQRHVPRTAIRATADSETGMTDLVRAGVGVGYLPVVLADRDPRLRRLSGSMPTFEYALWVLTHPDLRHTPRVRVVTGALADALVEQSEHFAA